MGIHFYVSHGEQDLVWVRWEILPFWNWWLWGSLFGIFYERRDLVVILRRFDRWVWSTFLMGFDQRRTSSVLLLIRIFSKLLNTCASLSVSIRTRILSTDRMLPKGHILARWKLLDFNDLFYHQRIGGSWIPWPAVALPNDIRVVHLLKHFLLKLISSVLMGQRPVNAILVRLPHPTWVLRIPYRLRLMTQIMRSSVRGLPVINLVRPLTLLSRDRLSGHHHLVLLIEPNVIIFTLNFANHLIHLIDFIH